jgi:hypothetical protein
VKPSASWAWHSKRLTRAVERDWGDHSDAIIAKKIDAIIAKRIMELAIAGERNPDLLCEQALDSLRSQRI